MSINKVILIGNLCKDPDIKATKLGKEIANLSVATNEQWKDKTTGETKKKTEFHNVVIYQEGIVRFVKQYIKKGDKVYIEGSLQTRKWQDKNDNDRYTTEIILQGYNCQLQALNSINNNEEF